MNPWRRALATVTVTRAAFLLVAFGAAWYLGGGNATGLSDLWRRWDADIYADIAERGYGGDGVVGHAIAFWPLVPLLIRALTLTGLTAPAAGMVLSFAGSVVAVAYLIRLTTEDTDDDETGARAGLYLAVAPAAVFLVAGFSEAVFLAGVIAAFFHARRGEWGAAALGAGVAVGARHVGVLLLPALAVEAWRRGGRSELPRALGAIAIASTPLLAWMGWLAATHDGPLAFLDAQRLGWGRGIDWPWDAFAATWGAFRGASANHEAAAYIEIVAALTGYAITAWTLARREWGYAVFCGLTMLAATASTWLFSVPRIVLTLFPVYVFTAMWTRDRPDRHGLVVAGSTVLATFGVLVFTRGAWLA